MFKKKIKNKYCVVIGGIRTQVRLDSILGTLDHLAKGQTMPMS